MIGRRETGGKNRGEFMPKGCRLGLASPRPATRTRGKGVTTTREGGKRSVEKMLMRYKKGVSRGIVVKR